MATTKEVQEQWFVCDGLVFTPGTGDRWNCIAEDGIAVSVRPVASGAAWDWSAELEPWVGVGTGQAETRDDAIRAAVKCLVDGGYGLAGLPRTDNEEAYGLALRIQAALDVQADQPFHLTDPRIDATFRCWTAEEVMAKADELDMTRFAFKEEEGYRQVDKVDGQWWVRGESTPSRDAGRQPDPSDKTLFSLQNELDSEALSGIQARAEQRWFARPGGVVDSGIDQKMACADANAFQRIQNQESREEAAIDIAANARQYPAYKQGLDELGRIKPPHGPLAEVIYDLDAENNKKIVAKEMRKAADLAAITQDRKEHAAAWTPQQAEAHARADANGFRTETDKTEKHFKADDIALNAAANPYYMKTLGAVAPEILKDATMKTPDKSLASDLSRIALGEMYSEQVVRNSVKRLEALRDQPEHADPTITKDRINQALVACKLAMHGVSDAHHKLQDASVLLKAADGLDVVHVQAVAATDDPLWKAQIQGLKDVTNSINVALAPEVIRADFELDKLREYGDDVSLEFDGKVEVFDDGTISAGFKRDAEDGMVYHVALMVPPGATQVTACAALSKGEQILVESESMPRNSVIGALDASVASFDSLKAKMPTAQATTLPIKSDPVFADAPGETGVAWANLCEEENRLAGYLSSLDEGTAVVLDDEAWYLEKVDDQQLVLMHGEVADGKIKNADSRFEFGLDWADIEVEDVRAYTSRVSSIADDFMIDRALWKTMKVEHDESPSLSM